MLAPEMDILYSVAPNDCIAPSAEMTASTTCPYCQVRVSKLQRHVRRAHPERVRLSSHETSVSESVQRSPSPPRPMLKCPLCRLPVCERNVRAHLAICLGADAARRRYARSCRNRALKSRKKRQRPDGKNGRRKQPGSAGHVVSPLHNVQDVDRNESVNQRIEHKLDLSRDYGYAYRENGRFGSHPAMDSYGEEDLP